MSDTSKAKHVDDLVISTPGEIGCTVRITSGHPAAQEPYDFVQLRVGGPVSHAVVGFSRAETLAIFHHLGDRLMASGGIAEQDASAPERPSPPAVGPCPCACNSGGFCGGCGHAGCGGRR